MFKPRTLKVLALLIAACLLLLLPGVLYPPYFETPAAWLLMAPYLSVSVLHKLGVPGLLEHNGLCGWGWCSPTPFGWALAVLAWTLAGWCLAWLLGTFTRRTHG